MTKPRRFNYVILAFLITTFAIGLFIFTQRLAEAHSSATLPSAQSISSPQATSMLSDPPPLGEACGAGELFPPSVICLHGTVSLINEMGTSTLLDGVPITVSYGGDALTGTTFVHPGQVTPTYGLDISSLEPAFLEPVTLTAVISDMIVSRQVLIFPDFRTQSQRFDVQVMAVGGLDEALIWGEVIDFATEGAVAGATVVAEYQGQQVTVTSTVQLSDSLPTYTLSQSDLASIGATAGSLITLTAMYNGDADQQVVIVPASSRQINFVTGWKCDGFNPLPDTGGSNGLPDTGGSNGLPDMACFWGYGLVDGMPKTGMSVDIEIDGTVHSAQTTLYPGEELPRYGIGVLDAEEMSGQMITVTGVYSGFTSSEVITVVLDSNLSQQVDIAVADEGALAEFTNGNKIEALAWHDGYLWAGTTGGVVRWNPVDESYIKFTTGNSELLNNWVYAIAVGMDNSLWFGTNGGVSHYMPDTNQWQSFTTSDGLIDNYVRAIAVDANNSLWIGTYGGVSHYTPTTTQWQDFTVGDGLPNNYIHAIAVDADNTIWVGTEGGVSHYTPNTNQWKSFTTSDGLVHNYVRAIAVDSHNSLWFGTDGGGVSHYTPDPEQWKSFTTSDGLLSNYVRGIVVGADNFLWFGTLQGVNRYSPDTNQWERFTTNEGIINNNVNSIAMGASNSLWAGTLKGVSHYTPGSGWKNLITNDGLINNDVNAIEVGADNSLWVGTPSGLNHYTPSLGWESFTTTDGLIDNDVRAIAVGTGSSLWFGTYNGVSHYTPSEGWESFTTGNSELVNNDIRAITVDSNNSLWFGTGDGVSHYTPSTNQWQSLTTNDGLVSNDVRAIAVDADDADSLWFGTYSGVSHYTPSTNQWESFTTTHGLVSNNVYAIAVAADNSLWVGTDSGVSQMRDGKWQDFTQENGLLNNNVYDIAAGVDNSLWFATWGGGVSHYIPGSGWESFTENDRLANNYVNTIAVGVDNTLWFGTLSGVTQWVAPIQQSDLSLQLSDPATTLPDRPFTYTLQIANHGELAVERPDLTLTLPVSATYLGASLPPSSTAPLSWEVGTLPANSSSMTLVVTATLAADVLPGTSAIASANIASIVPESYLSNNNSQVTTLVRDPYRSDVGVSLSGPPLLVPDSEAVYHLWVNNSGGLPATATLLTVELPPELTVQGANPAPTSQEPLRWEIGTLPELSPISTISLTLNVAADVSAGDQLTVSAVITTTSPDSEVSNNIATSTVPTSLADAETLILVAPNRFTTRYGASPLLSRLYSLAAHPLVDGVVLDVERDSDVQAAYGAWDTDPGSWQKANAVAESIKALIDNYTIEYPNLQYLVVVGGDAMIPFYRVNDQSPTTLWHERQYSRQLGRHDTARAALASNLLLTDDFYADRSPSVPESYFWFDKHTLYLPDFAIGRLVETPAEMISLIDAFLANEGQLTLNENTVGSFDPLTNDLGAAQCSTLLSDGMTALCTNSKYNFRQEALNQESGASWSAFHSNHFSQGSLSSHDIFNRAIGYEQMLLVSIGCHAGLNAADDNSASSLDLPQAILGRGGSYIASTSYAYASGLGISYSEALSLELTEQLLDGSTQSLGEALVRAKQAYYASHGWFSYLDEKVLLPMTLYGLPMLQVTTPESQQVREAIAPPAALSSTSHEIGTLTVVTYTLSDADYTRHEIDTGVYYDFETQVIEQEGYPVQPTLLVPLTDNHPSPPREQGEGSPHGVILRSATYTEEATFDPVIVQSWAIGEKHLLQAEPPAVNERWDRPIPYSLAHFDGLFEREASLNLVLGAYDSEHEVERLYENLTLELLYSESLSRTAPVIHAVTGDEVNSITYFKVTASAESEVREVIAVCDDGVGHWRTTSLNYGSTQQWEGSCQSAERFYVQVVDEVGNVAVSEWQAPSDAPTSSVLLALSPPTVTIGIGQTFDLPIVVHADTLPIDGASAYLNFEPAYLQVASISPSNALPTVLQESFDNASGQINFAAGTFDTFPTGSFSLATVTFTATAEIDGSQIDFNRTLPRQSDVTFAGISFLSDTVGSTITVENATLNGCVTLQGHPEPPHPSLSVSLRVSLTATGQSTPAYHFTPTTDENGCFTLNGIIPNSYEVRVKKSTTLQTMQEISLQAGSNSIDFGLLREGDADDNNYVTIIDFSILRGSFGRCEEDTGYDERAEFNGDGCVTILDFSLLASNFGEGGAHQLARSRSQQPLNDVALVITPQTSSTNINPGDIITLSVQLQAGTQSVDGAQIMLTFDPTILEVLQLRPKSALPLELEKQFDNTNGTLSFAAGTFSDFPTGTFDILELQFKALAPTDGTPLTFQLSQTTDSPTGTDVTFAGHTVLGDHSNGIVIISSEPTAITLQQFQHASPSQLWLLIPLMFTVLAGIRLVVSALALQGQKR